MTARSQELLDRAKASIEEIDPASAIALRASDDVLFVDVRDTAELHRSGIIPGSLHAERGMLEFYIDPESPFHKPALASGKRLIFYCAGGARSALSAETAQRMGLPRVAHVQGGFEAWTKAGGPVAHVLGGGVSGERVTGIGGIFFKARDKEKLAAWYAKHLGITDDAGGGALFRWRELSSDREGGTVWSIFRSESTYFAPSTAEFMINYRVPDLRGLLAKLRAEGVSVDDKVEEADYGIFGWCLDPEGNRLELWQPLP